MGDSPILKSSATKRTTKKDKIKLDIRTSPDLSRPLSSKKQKLICVNEIMDRIKKTFTSNDNQPASFICHRNSRKNDVDFLNTTNTIMNEEQYNKLVKCFEEPICFNKLPVKNDVINKYSRDCSNDVAAPTSPILGCQGKKNALNSSININKKKIRKKLFNNFDEKIYPDESINSINTNTGFYNSAELRENLTSTPTGNVCVEVKNKLEETDKENNSINKTNLYSPIIKILTKPSSNYKRISSKTFISNLKKLYSQDEKHDDSVIQGIHELKSPEKSCVSEFCSRNGVDNLSQSSIKDVTQQGVRTPERKCQSSNAEFTISEFPSPCLHTQTPLQRIKRTTNFDKVWSVEKSRFENMFNSESNEFCVIDHSSPVLESQKKKALTSDLLDERQSHFSNNFSEPVEDLKIVDSDDLNNSDKDNENRSKKKLRRHKHLNYKSIQRRKKINNLNMISTLEIDPYLKMRHIEDNDRAALTSRLNDSLEVTINDVSKNATNCNRKSKLQSDIVNCDNITNNHILSKNNVYNKECTSSKLQTPNSEKFRLINDTEIVLDSSPDSLIIDLNTQSSDSRVFSQFCIENIPSPPGTTNNKFLDEFSDRDLVDYERRTPPSKLLHKTSVDLEEILDSGSKQRRKKYPEDSLVGRIRTIRNRYESDVRLKRHMLSDSGHTSINFPVLTVKAFSQEYSRFLIICNNGNQSGHCEQTVNTEYCPGLANSNDIATNEIYILTESMVLPNENISVGMLLRVYPPWKVLNIPDEDVTVVLGVTCLEIVSKSCLSSDKLITSSDSNRSVTATFNCCCTQGVENPACSFRLHDGHLIDILCPLPRTGSSNGIELKRIPRLYFHENYLAGTIGNFRVYHMLNHESFIEGATYDLTYNENVEDGKRLVAIKDKAEEIAIIVLSTRGDILKWRLNVHNSNKSRQSFKFVGLKFTHRNLVTNCKILKQYELVCSSDQPYVYYLAPASDWWSFLKSDCNRLISF